MQELERQAPLLDAVNLKKYYPVKKGILSKPKLVKAVDGVSFTLERGKNIGDRGGVRLWEIYTWSHADYD